MIQKANSIINEKPVLLELFSGTGSVGRAFRALGWEVFSVDIDAAAKPNPCSKRIGLAAWCSASPHRLHLGKPTLYPLFPCSEQGEDTAGP